MVVEYLDPSNFIIDSGASRNMASVKDLITSMYSDSGPTVRMGDGFEIQAKGVCRINLDNGYFNNVLYVLELEVNLLLV